MARNTQLKQCERCKEREATAGVVQSFYFLKTATPNAEEQVKGPLPTRGYCSQCLLDLSEEESAKDSAIATIREVLAKVQRGRQNSKTRKAQGRK